MAVSTNFSHKVCTLILADKDAFPTLQEGLGLNTYWEGEISARPFPHHTIRHVSQDRIGVVDYKNMEHVDWYLGGKIVRTDTCLRDALVYLDALNRRIKPQITEDIAKSHIF